MDLRSRYDRMKADWEEINTSLKEYRQRVSAHQLRAWRKRRAYLSRELNSLKAEVNRLNKLQPTLFQ